MATFASVTPGSDRIFSATVSCIHPDTGQPTAVSVMSTSTFPVSLMSSR